ncbi:hypothetical protein Pint_02581 [Pistacia integerrima]|uniref:Uncharacterized protein n=1 Tax=Pistacia integerrima TaxID=434235 RepID=A0ACC0ZJK0_9ROSI|nr:hypothetical protein Pint_02581 [Pistacia integerrima]
MELVASEFSSPKRGTVIGVVVDSVALLVLLGLVVFLYLRRRKKTIKITKAVEGSLMAFAYKDLQNPTENFSKKLGGGGFGSVFKGPIRSKADVEKVSRICNVAGWCIQDYETQRPIMGQVVQILEESFSKNSPSICEQIIFFTESSSSQSS